jgi:hypothetical protein
LIAKPLRAAVNLFGLRLDIVSGHHQGATRTFSRLSFSVGSDVADDLSVFADPLEPAHFKVWRTHPLGSKVRLLANSGAIVLDDGARLERHAWADRPLPTAIRANGVEITLTQNLQVEPLLKPAGAVALLVAGGWMAASLLGLATGQSGPSMATPSAAPGLRLAASGTTDHDVGVLNDRLHAAGLDQHITLSDDGSNVLTASGAITPAEATDWRAILKWFDGTGARAWLVNKVSTTAEVEATPSIASVWFDGGKAQVELSDRSVVGVGTTFGDNWLIDAVDHDGVEMSRGGRQVKLAFQGADDGQDR